MKFLRFTVVLIGITLLTSCTYEQGIDISIEEDNTGIITRKILFDESTWDLVGTEFENSLDEYEEEENVDIELIEENGKQGARIIVEFANLEELKETFTEDDIPFVYTIDSNDEVSVEIEFPTTVEEDSEGPEVNIIYDILITVPKIVESNAEDIEDNTMHWDFDSDETNIVTFTYSKVPMITKVLKVLLYVVFGGLIIGCLYFVYSRLIKPRISNKENRFESSSVEEDLTTEENNQVE